MVWIARGRSIDRANDRAHASLLLDPLRDVRRLAPISTCLLDAVAVTVQEEIRIRLGVEATHKEQNVLIRIKDYMITSYD